MENGISPEREAEIFDGILLNFRDNKTYTREQTQEPNFYGNLGRFEVENHLNTLIDDEKKLKESLDGIITLTNAGRWILSNFPHKSYVAQLNKSKVNEQRNSKTYYLLIITAVSTLLVPLLQIWQIPNCIYIQVSISFALLIGVLSILAYSKLRNK